MAKSTDDSNIRTAKEAIKTVLQILEDDTKFYNLSGTSIGSLFEGKGVPKKLEKLLTTVCLSRNTAPKLRERVMQAEDENDTERKQQLVGSLQKLLDYDIPNSREDAIKGCKAYLTGTPLEIPAPQSKPQPNSGSSVPESYPLQSGQQQAAGISDLEKIVADELKSTTAEMKVIVENFKDEFSKVSEYTTKEIVRIQKAIGELSGCSAKIDALGKELPKNLEQLQTFSDKAMELMPTKEELENLQAFKTNLAGLPSITDISSLAQKFNDIKQKADGIEQKMNQITPAEFQAYTAYLNELKATSEKMKETFEAIAQAKYSKEDLQRVRALILTLGKLSAYDVEAMEKKLGEISAQLPEIAEALKNYPAQIKDMAYAQDPKKSENKQLQQTSSSDGSLEVKVTPDTPQTPEPEPQAGSRWKNLSKVPEGLKPLSQLGAFYNPKDGKFYVTIEGEFKEVPSDTHCYEQLKNDPKYLEYVESLNQKSPEVKKESKDLEGKLGEEVKQAGKTKEKKYEFKEVEYKTGIWENYHALSRAGHDDIEVRAKSNPEGPYKVIFDNKEYSFDLIRVANKKSLSAKVKQDKIHPDVLKQIVEDRQKYLKGIPAIKVAKTYEDKDADGNPDDYQSNDDCGE